MSDNFDLAVQYCYDYLDNLFETNTFEKSNYAYLINSVDYNIPAVINSLLTCAFAPLPASRYNSLKP